MLVVVTLCFWRRHKPLTSIDGKNKEPFDLKAVHPLKAEDEGLAGRQFEFF